MKTQKLVLFLITCCLANLAVAQIYQVINEDGSVSFTDQAPLEGNGQEVSLGETIIQPAVVIPSPTVALSPQPQQEIENKNIRIHAPADESVIHGADNSVVISVSVTPAIAEGESLQLLHNGTPYSSPQTSGQWNLTRINPGTQKYAVRLLNSSGTTISQSATITLYVIL